MTGSWGTVPARRRVLAVARTTTSLNRVLDVLPVFADDTRIHVTFTVDEGSAFSVGVADHLKTLGARTISWADSTKTEFDLVIAASDHSDLHELRGPLFLLPHGAGFQKYSPHSDLETSPELSGLTKSSLWHLDHPVPAKVALSHDNQREQLDETLPSLRDRAVVIGDPCIDRLVELAQYREHYRSALGLGSDQKLVTVTSTWGHGSALGRWPALPAQLLAELPHDEFRVATVLHPNIWAHHGKWQIQHWLRRASEGGLLLFPPTGPWQLAMALAHCVIGDHGSLSTYTTALARPLLLAAFNDAEVPPSSAMADLGKLMPRLDDRLPLAPQVRHAITNADYGLQARLADRVFAKRGQSLRLLQTELYALLELTPPPHPPRASTLVVDRDHAPPPRSFQVETRLSDDGKTITLSRFPAVLTEFVPDGRRHLATTDGELNEPLLENAAVIIGQVPQDTDIDAEQWAASTLARFPGCQLVSCPRTAHTSWLWSRNGRKFTARVLHRLSAAAELEFAASALHVQLTGETAARFPASFLVRAGPASVSIKFGERA